MSKYCSNCGAEVLEGVSFCGGCGEPIVKVTIDENSCSNCGYIVAEDEKYCPECGTQIIDKFNTSKGLGVNKEGGTISDKPEVIAPKKSEPIKKKKRSFLGCLGKSLLFIILILVIGIVIIWNLPEDDIETTIDTTNIPGIVDIEDDDVDQDDNSNKNSSNFSKNSTTESTISNAAIESNNLNQITKSVEEVFENADTIKLKQILSSTSLKMYKGSFSEIEPYMNEYSKAFKNRKLVHSSKIYALYSFKDKEGNEHTAKFANDNGTWKLIHF